METTDNSNMIHNLIFDDKEILLIGTAHVSRESTELVQKIIENEKPDTVCVELCESRYQAIRQKNRWQNTNIIKVIKEKKAFLLLSNLILASFQKRIADKLDIRPGQEMITAIETADAVDADIHLSDRDIRITLSRTWRTMGLWRKIKLLFQLILSMGGIEEISEEDIEKMKQEDVLENLLSEVGKSIPELRDIVIDERDQYLARKITTAPGKKIVAVVGAGHLVGIKKYWNAEIDISSLETLPAKKKSAGLLKWIIPGIILCLFIAGFFYGGTEMIKEMAIYWILANSVLAGLGALIAMGHPLTIGAAILAAPLTSLNPMIAAGWVAGIVEAFLRKPKVKDFENLQEDIRSAKGFWTNTVTRILLVMVFTNIGSVIGTFVAAPLMVKIFNSG